MDQSHACQILILQIAKVILIPSWHNGRHVTILDGQESTRLFFSEPPNYDVATLRATSVKRAELWARMSALADETRLGIKIADYALCTKPKPFPLYYRNFSVIYAIFILSMRKFYIFMVDMSEIVKKRVVYTLPGMEAVTTRKNLTYKTVDGTDLKDDDERSREIIRQTLDFIGTHLEKASQRV